MASVWFDGVDDLNRLAADLGQAGRDAAPLARIAVRKTAADIAADAKAFAPVDTGNLKNSISVDYADSNDGAAADIGPTAAYGAFVEYGTSVHAPQAFMGPAFDRRAPDFEQALGQLMDGFRP